MRFDYKPTILTRIKSNQQPVWKFIIPAISLIFILIIFLTNITAPNYVEESVNNQTISLSPIEERSLFSYPKRQIENSIIKDNRFDWNLVKVANGENLSIIFKKNNFSETTLLNILESSKNDKIHLINLKPGQTVKFKKLGSGKLGALSLDISPLKTINISRNSEDQSFVVSHEHRQFETILSYCSGIIDSSFFVSAQKAGLKQKTIMQLVQILGWDIDFALDIRPNDEFKVLYEKIYINGKEAGIGDIVALEFINRGKAFKAIKYITKDGAKGYFTPEGYGMERAFIRTPVKFTRISSHFNLNRKHPILHKIRAHKGVDYAAPINTPVKATSDGKVLFAGKKNGYGNIVELRHGPKYTTAYAHLNKFANGIKKGNRVKQGQIIGYVGKTGLATAPHLHYEFRVNGKHRNPITVKLPKKSPISKQHRDKFYAHAMEVLKVLDNHHTRIARK